MEEEKKPEWEVAQTNDTVKTNKKTKSFIIKYIIFVIILISITAIGIVFSMKHIDETISQVEILEEPEIESSEKIDGTKKSAEDSIYGIKSYSETYDTNSLEIKEYNDTDGKIVKETQETGMQVGLYSDDFNYNINFIQIDGLKNQEIQDKINAKLKNVPYTLEKEKHIWSSVTANFSNVLSVVISNDIYDNQDRRTLNFDLTTGEEISFEKLFVSSAPIKSILAGAMYEDYAWDLLNENFEQYEGFLDMKNVDTSEIEDQSLLVAKKYDKIKDEIIFSFSPTHIYIGNPELGITIDILEYANEIAIYKRYLTEDSIFEDDSLGTKGLIVFTQDLPEDKKQINYGKIADNIFVEQLLWGDQTLQDEEMNTINEYVKKLANEQITMLKQQTSSNNGVILQTEYFIYRQEEGFFSINAHSSKAECSLSYFKKQAFKDYIIERNFEDADAALNRFSSYDQEKFPELQISEEDKTYYLSPTGEFLGNTIEEVESKVWE